MDITVVGTGEIVIDSKGQNIDSLRVVGTDKDVPLVLRVVGDAVVVTNLSFAGNAQVGFPPVVATRTFDDGGW
jgi:hypothetical protein